jgi:GT2 family glycosyltransferase
MIRKAKDLGAEFYLALNADMILGPDALEKIMIAMEGDKELGSLAPKIRQWDFEQKNKTSKIDSCGIVEISALRFKDLGQGEEDIGQYDSAEIIGPSGAAALYRLSALEAAKEGEGAFDENMFMYEEDCDLAYRLRLYGYKSKLAPDAIIYHDRTAGAKGTSNWQVAKNRKNKSRNIRARAFLNKHIIFVKYWRTLKTKEKLEVLWFAGRMFIFAIIFEQYLLKEYIKLIHLYKRKKIKIYNKM